MRFIQICSAAILSFLVIFTATALASTAAVSPDEGSLLELARPIFDAVMHGNWWLAAAGAVMLLTAAARRHLPNGYGGRFIRGDVGGMVTAFTFAYGGAIATTMAAPGATMSAAVMLAALKIGGMAVGGFVALHKLAQALVATKWFQAKAPAWLRTGLGLVLSLIGSSAIKKAEKAGQAAVDAKPATGIVGVVGKPTEIE
jgi:hypothetical protein